MSNDKQLLAFGVHKGRILPDLCETKPPFRQALYVYLE